MSLIPLVLLVLAMVYGAGCWLFAMAMYLTGRMEAYSPEVLNDYMFKVGIVAILSAGFLYLGDKL